MQHPLRRSLLLLLSLLPLSAQLSPPGPQPVSDIISVNGCGTFAMLLRSSGEAAASFAFNFHGGLTAFIPTDPVMKPFLPRFENLTVDAQASLLLYHAIPVYYSATTLKSKNGVFTTLATDGASKNYNFTIRNEGEVVTVRTDVTTAAIKGTIFDADPVALYAIDGVLQPPELFEKAVARSPAPENAGVEVFKQPAAASPGEKAAGKKAVGNAGADFGGVIGVAAAAAVFCLVFV